MSSEVKARRQAMIDDVLCVQVEPGTKIFDLSVTPEKLLGVVGNGLPVINHKANTCYLSTDDFNAAERALPKPTRH